METKSINIEIREEKGKNSSRRLREKGYIPGVLYSHGTSESIKILQKDFYKLFKGHITESVIFDLNMPEAKGSAEHMAFVKDYQRNPRTGELLHVDLFRVTKGEKIHTQVPIELTGAAIGVKLGGILESETRIIEVECLPLDLPEKIVIDITNLELGHAIHARDIKLADGIKLLSNPENVIVSVHLPKKAEEKAAVEGEGAAEAAPEAAKGADNEE